MLISLQIMVKSFVSNRIIDLSYSLNKYKQYKHCLKWVVYINTLLSPCIAWIGMKSCSKFLRILVITMHFTNQNWIIVLHRKFLQKRISSVSSLYSIKVVSSIQSSQVNCILFIFNQTFIYIAISIVFLPFNMEKRKRAIKYSPILHA